MTIRLSEQAVEALTDAPRHVRTALEKQLCFLSADLHHPSLRAKKGDASRDLWQARVNRGYAPLLLPLRFTSIFSRLIFWFNVDSGIRSAAAASV